jgi:benzylsuccinate CoA-transferase BbsE subunit
VNDLLADLKVLEFADDAGAYVGKLLADAGADVTRVEPTTLPFGWWSVDPDAAADRFLHRTKHRLPLRLDEPADRRRLTELLARADVVVESGHPRSLRDYGLQAEAELVHRPGLIWVRITPFGTDGPLADRLGSDLVCAAVGGFLALAGYPDTEPVRAYGDQALRMAALHAAVGVALALVDRESTGHGQLVDVAIQEAVATALENSLQFYDLEQVVRNRTGQGYAEAGSGVFACRDGLVYLMAGRLSTKAGWQNLITWMISAGVPAADELLQPQWQDHAFRALPHAEQTFRAIFERFAAGWPAADLYHEAQQRGIVLCPVSSPAQLVGNEQLMARGFFTADGEEAFVGPPFRLASSARPGPAPANPAGARANPARARSAPAS